MAARLEGLSFSWSVMDNESLRLDTLLPHSGEVQLYHLAPASELRNPDPRADRVRFMLQQLDHLADRLDGRLSSQYGSGEPHVDTLGGHDIQVQPPAIQQVVRTMDQLHGGGFVRLHGSQLRHGIQ